MTTAQPSGFPDAQPSGSAADRTFPGSPFTDPTFADQPHHDADPRGGTSGVATHLLDDRYTAESGTIYLTGIQALVRMVRDRARLDRRQNLRTASFISGYEGSPLAGYDLELARRRSLLTEYDVVHQPGVNEELAATAVMGSQVAGTVATLREGCDGVVGYWYGKAPGLDRASDAIRHANLIGTHPRGGAVALVGDDPGAKSSTVPCASEMSLADMYLPTLYPQDAQDILDLGVHAAVLSRISGLWTAMKISAHVADGACTATVDPDRILPVYGDLGPGTHVPSGRLLGKNLMELEQSQLTVRLPRALEYARINRLNRIVVRTDNDRIGIVAAGKTYLDMREALRLIGISDRDLARFGIRILKLGMIYPLEMNIVNEFVADLDEVIVVEEKRDFIETMMRERLFGRARVPVILGKSHADGSELFSRFGEFDVDKVATGLARSLARRGVTAAQAWLDRQQTPRTRIPLPLAARSPYFCSGCPHNSSTKVPDGVLVGAGIGCHAMVLLMDPQQVGDIAGVTQMGGEGAQWVGMAPFVTDTHFVQNIGDGTFLHSGSLALRQAVASGVDITYKLLFNGAVAMTGGQHPVGEMSLREVVKVLLAEGVRQVVITSDDPKRSAKGGLPRGVQVRHRDDLLAVQTELAAVPGVTVLIHDQHCAAEKRRLRKRDAYPTPKQRVAINTRICEGCGDCGHKSNCLSVHPVDTEYGRKTEIDQSSCNLDFSCLEGDCPAFVRVTPGEQRQRARAAELTADDLPEPDNATPAADVAIRITGIGGTGVVTVSQVLATAAVLDGKLARTVDMTGLAQKGGAVVSDIKITAEPVDQSAKLPTGGADLYLACDELVAADPDNLRAADPTRTVAVVSTSQIPTGAMVSDPTVTYPAAAAVRGPIDDATRRGVYLDALALSTSLLGDEQYANMMLVGAAYQVGALGVSAIALERAIELNGVAVAANVQAFRQGRAAVLPQQTPADTTTAPTAIEPMPSAVAAVVAGFGADAAVQAHVRRRAAELVRYQSARYAARYGVAVQQIWAASHHSELTQAVADGLFKLMAYKDEYEVARLARDAAVHERIAAEFGADARTSVMLHPPLLRAAGMRHKIALGRWANPGLRALEQLKFLRGTVFDPCGYTEVRRTERALVREYIELLGTMGAALAAETVTAEQLVEVAALPDMVRGYENIKLAAVDRYHAELSRLRLQLGLTTAANY